ncbi:MAG: N-6 DNA methylase [Defluviitaleaceae bacterium]|nr:N-6 DNA methylase [Defluviitaleaceae bacterium]
MKNNKSIEEKVEDLAKKQIALLGCDIFLKTDIINPEIENAMRKAPSKTGGDGGNRPDIRLLLKTSSGKYIPIIIEVKGQRGKLIKLNPKGEVYNKTAEDKPNYTNISSFAVNGAVHYAEAIIGYSESYKEVISIGFNGYIEAGELKTELDVYYISDNNFSIPKRVGEFSDFSFLAPDNFDDFIQNVENLNLTTEEIETQSRKIEERIEISLKNLNQSMHDDLQIPPSSRVELVAGMIMAGLGVQNKVDKLEIPELKGQMGRNTNDGTIFINKISDFLTERELPVEKKDMLVNNLARVFVHSGLYNPINGESKLKTIYIKVKTEILPIFTSAHHLDFTGKLFNILNTWVDIPDSDKNDVVLTPRYVTTMMAKLAKVDRNSYVWDYAAGSAGFLISAMNIMIEDARNNIKSPDELNKKIAQIKINQLLGIEMRPDIYLLAVLNMILMGDGSSNILHKNSLTDYSGNYEWGYEKDTPFPANVFLLNPPYSAEGKGFIFVKKALERMKSGRAVILIQENAGSINGLPFTRELLKNNTLLASIRMADIFKGKAGVQTAVYVIEIGKAHDVKQMVKFINMTNDGYTRQNRRKSSLDVNLKNTANANERYQEVVDLVNYGKSYLNYFTEEEYVENTITLEGNDWTFADHRVKNNVPLEGDFLNVIEDYFIWKLGRIIKGEHDKLSYDKIINKNTKNSTQKFKKFPIVKVFNILKTKSLKKYKAGDLKGKCDDFYNLPALTAGVQNQGLAFYVPKDEATVLKNVISVSANGANSGIMFYQPYEFTVLQDSYAIGCLIGNPNEKQYLYLVTALQKSIRGYYEWTNKAGWARIKNEEIHLPVTDDGEIDFVYMENYINELSKIFVQRLEQFYSNK